MASPTSMTSNRVPIASHYKPTDLRSRKKKKKNGHRTPRVENTSLGREVSENKLEFLIRPFVSHFRLSRATIQSSVHTSHCRTRCLDKNMFIHMSSHARAFVALFYLLRLSLVPLHSLSLLLVLCSELQLPRCRERRALNPMRTLTMKSLALSLSHIL